MTTFSKFEEIEAWQEARELIRKVRTICKRPNTSKDFSFTDQITRASRSITANIAEGNDALTIRDFIKFLGYAKRSSAEVRSHLYDALDEEYISHTELEQLSEVTKKIGGMLTRLIQYLQTAHKNQRIQRKSNPLNVKSGEPVTSNLKRVTKDEIVTSTKP